MWILRANLRDVLQRFELLLEELETSADDIDPDPDLTGPTLYEA